MILYEMRNMRADVEMSSAGVGFRSCGYLWDSVVLSSIGARTCLRSHQARPEERLLPLNVHFTGDLVVGPT